MDDRQAGMTVGQAAKPTRQRRFDPVQKHELLRVFEDWEGTMNEFCARHQVSSTSLCAWRRAYRTHGAEGLKPGPDGRTVGRKARHMGPYRPEQRQQAVEAFQKSGQPLKQFAKLWKVSPRILTGWVERYDEGGAAGLMKRVPGPPRGRPPLAAGLTDQIVAVKQEFPFFGLKKIKAFLGRFRGVAVSTGSIRKTVAAAGLPPGKSHKGKAARAKPIRFFERAAPGLLWQSDWTSLVLPRTRQRVWLIVFLDDHSRYVVSFGLHLGQRSEHVVECLREGIERFGKPTEVLTDQGPQYFAWRGTSEFQQTLKREGIRHRVARSHHPQTLGKCERFWGTVQEEFWARANPVDLADARARFALFLAHYNHFRPHQGIGNLVPADRLFGAASPVRESLRKALTGNELRLAVDEVPRAPVYLTGQVGGQAVSLVGEGGTLVFRGADGVRHELNAGTLGMAAAARKEGSDEHGDEGHAGGGAGGPGGAAGGVDEGAPVSGQAQGDVPAAAPGGAGEGVAAGGNARGESGSAPGGDGDPGDVVGEADAGGCGEGVGGAGGADEAAGGRGAVGDGGGAAAAAQADAEDPAVAGGGSEAAPESLGGGGAEERDPGGAGGAVAGSAGEPGAGAGPGA